MKKYKLPKMKKGGVAKDTHKTKDGKTAKKGLYYYMNRKKKKGTSNSKSKSTVSDKAYANMKAGFPKKRFGGISFKYGGIVNNTSFCNCNYKKIK